VRTAVDDIDDAYRTYGSGAAWGKFVSLVMHDGPVTDAGVQPAAWPPAGSDGEQGEAEDSEDVDGLEIPPEASGKQQADDELFFLRMLKPFGRRVIVGWVRPPAMSLHGVRPRLWPISSEPRQLCSQATTAASWPTRRRSRGLFERY
jgi:hypothetical protein